MSDWDRPGYAEGFCEALAKRVAAVERRLSTIDAWLDLRAKPAADEPVPLVAELRRLRRIERAALAFVHSEGQDSDWRFDQLVEAVNR